MEKIIIRLLSLFLLIAAGTITAGAQQKLHLSVAGFEQDQLDLSAQHQRQKDSKFDAEEYSIVKVTSDNPDDDLTAYTFNFGQIDHSTEGLHDDELWLYVQRNARYVTITRQGYTTVNKHQLTPVVQAGKVYRLRLSCEMPKVYTQMVEFHVQPVGAAATVMVTGSKKDAQEEIFGTVDPATGQTAKALEYGTYTYRVLSNDGKYHPQSGKFTLRDKTKTHTETVTLRPNFSEMTLTVNADADIYVNDKRMGRRSWTGTLKAGSYTVECRQQNHRNSSQYITVGENDNRTITLMPPTPITGTLAVTSSPSGATISIDGKDYGQTPRQITDLLIGRHTVKLSKQNYQSSTQTVEIKEEQTTQHSATLSNIAKMTITSQPSGAYLSIDGKQVGQTPYSADLASGDYQLRLTKSGYSEFNRRVHLSSSNPNVSYTLRRQLIKPSCFYLQGGLQLGSFTAVEGALGAFIKNVNIEGTFDYMLAAGETVYWNTTTGNSRIVECTYKPMSAGVRLGYGFILGTNLRLTPQVGARHLFTSGNTATEHTNGAQSSYSAPNAAFHATSGLVALRADYAITPMLCVYAAPEVAFAVKKSDDFKRVADLSSKVKGWATGFNIRLGLSLCF